MKKNIDVFNSLSEEKQSILRSKFEEFLHNPHLSNQKLAEEYAQVTGIKIDRKAIAALMQTLGYPKRTPTIVKESKAVLGKEAKNTEEKEHVKLIKKVEAENLIQEYAETSLSQVATKYNTTSYVVKTALKSLQVEVRKPASTYKEIIDEMKSKGYDKERIAEIYLDGRSFKSFKTEIERTIERETSSTTLNRMLKHLNISKPTELIRIQQGAKSRRESLIKEERLKTIGFASSEEAAKHFIQDTNITQQQFLTMLNEKIGEEIFTEKWFRDKIQPHLPHHSRNHWGVSREESGLAEWLRNELPDDIELLQNVRTIIYPREVDIYIPQLKIAIEFNGLPWHTRSYMMKARGIDAYQFHKEKLDDCAAKSIELLYVWSDDWALNQEGIKALLRRKIADPSISTPQLQKLLCNDDLADDDGLFMQGQAAVDEKILKLYKKFSTVAAVSKELQTSRAYVRQSLKRSGVKTEQFTYKTLIKILEEAGVNRDELHHYYVVENHTRRELIQHIKEKTVCDKNIGFDMLDNILKHYSLSKTSLEH